MLRGAGSRARRAAGCVALLVAAALLCAPAGAGAAQEQHGRLLGIVNAKSPAASHARTLAPLAVAPQLTYHGGPVVHDGHVYAIFWEAPGHPFPADFKGAVIDYFKDVAADSGARTNVYSVSRQYGDATGPADYRVAFQGSLTDTDAMPENGCTDPENPVCLTDAQLRDELRNFVIDRGLPRGMTSQYFFFTPPGVGSCGDSSADECAFSSYCAYHSWAGAPGGTLLYAIHPFVQGVDACDVGESPTGTSADPVLNVVSHEHNEVITDPTGSAWYDSNGDENGDKCSWNFGSLFGTPGARYNQIVGGHPYLLQLEWSNKQRGCAGTMTNDPPRAAFFKRGVARAKKRLRFDASVAWDEDGTIAKYAWSFGDGAKGTGRVASHEYARGGRYRVRLTVTDNEGAKATTKLVVKIAKARRRHAQHRSRRR